MSNLNGMHSTSKAPFMNSVAAVLADPCTSNALRQQIQVDLTRDPLDALADAERQLELCRIRVQEVFDSHSLKIEQEE